MKIGSIGYNYSHNNEFVMDRPNGVGCWLLLIIKTPALFTLNGEVHHIKKNSFVILSPNTPVTYRASEDTYTDDWLYFSADRSDIEKFRSLEIPTDRIIYLGNTDELSSIMQSLAFEHYSSAAHHNEIESFYLDILIHKLSRIICSGAEDNGEQLKRNHAFTMLRSRIYTMPEAVGSIDDMAREVSMSRSGFQHLYKQLFGVNVMADVISGRLDRAKRLLISTNMTIHAIAERCGYSNEYNFMRQFKNYIGLTPTEYRRQVAAATRYDNLV